MNEAEFYRRHLRPTFKDWGDFFRVENSAQSGTPDINYAIAVMGRTAQGWIETKVSHPGGLHFEKFQLPWMKRRLRYTGDRFVWVLALIHDMVFLIEAKNIVNKPTYLKGKWLVIAYHDLQPKVTLSKPWRWDMVKRALLEEAQDYTPTK